MTKPKILVYCDTNWSLGRVNRSIEKWLKDEFDFSFYDWSQHSPEYIFEIINDYDIILTNLYIINFDCIKDKCLKKFIFICHGYPEIKDINFDYPLDTLYSVTSKQIVSLFPEHIKSRLFYTLNGVEPEDFTFIQRSGNIQKIGWCGGTHVESKRAFWTEEIANKCELDYEIQTNLSYDEIRDWYNTIDILLVNAGPESWAESGPLPPFEAIVSGVLVIGTRVGNFMEIPGPKYDTIDEAISIVNELKNDPKRVLDIMKQQYDYVIKYWTYEKIIDSWRTIFHASLVLSS